MQSKQLRRSFPSKSTVNSSVSHNVDSKENVEYYNGDTFGKNEWAKSTFEIRAKRNMKKSQSVDPTHKEYNSDTRQRTVKITNDKRSNSQGIGSSENEQKDKVESEDAYNYQYKAAWNNCYPKLTRQTSDIKDEK